MWFVLISMLIGIVCLSPWLLFQSPPPQLFRVSGIENLRFKHTYNPYTEPSMEIYAFHKHLNKWVEIGNSGLFRPEMLLPMGLPEDVNVAGFGLSLER